MSIYSGFGAISGNDTAIQDTYVLPLMFGIFATHLLITYSPIVYIIHLSCV